MQGKKINRVACGSAHTIAWSTSKPLNAGKLPNEIPMEYNHLQPIPLPALRNRLMLLHHFSDLFCTSLPQFDLQPPQKDDSGPLVGLDTLRGVLIPSGKVTIQCRSYILNGKRNAFMLSCAVFVDPFMWSKIF